MSGKVKFIIAAGFALAVSSVSYGQNPSTAATVALNATLAEALTVTATPATLAISLVSGGTSPAAGPVTINTSWVLKSSRANVSVLGYLSSAAAALSDGAGDNIPSSEVLGSVNAGTYTAFTGNAANGIGLAGASLPIGTTAITATNRSGSRSDSLNLEVNLTNQPQLPAAAYTGTLNLQAVAY
jgi:hypothetical protein